MEFKDRLRARMTDLKLTATDLSAKIGVSKATITFWRNGTNGATGSNLMELAKALKCSPMWLETGKGSMEVGHTEPSNVSMAEQPTRMYRYPVVSWVAAGEWSEAVEPYPPGAADEYDVSDYKAKGPAFWLVVKGDSMTAPTAPSVPEGSQILVDTRAEVLPGKLVIAKLAGSNEATFKKLVEDGGVRYLKPLNSAYPTVQCADDCRIIGVVVRALTKFA
ncbi:LexA family protein [Pseudomonas syringae]|uniref:LexA family protein n=1 Tax=Pseudomonas syringae TaxID=317 RepID=UPI00200B1791|nr:LexA family transcriptional regulator [Pseudomonas syringae]MCK9706195.1 LexA family transcriptional regulator [Pseudomonas syringae pv. syringae]